MTTVRRFSGTGWVECAPGNIGSTLAGPWSLGCVVRTEQLTEVWQTIVSFENGGSFASLEVASTGSGELFVYMDGDESYGGQFPVGTWVLVWIVKGPGTVAPDILVYRWDTDQWTQDTGDAAIGPVDTPLSIVCIGAWERTNDPWQGDIAALGLWSRELTVPEMQSLNQRIVDWRDSSPAALWLVGADPVTDVTGGGADETDRSGTSLVDDLELPFDLALDDDPAPGDGDGLPNAVRLIPGVGDGSPRVSGTGVSNYLHVSVGSASGSPQVSGGGVPNVVRLIPGVGDGPSLVDGDGLPNVVRLIPGDGDGSPQVSGGGVPNVVRLIPGVGDGSPRITGGGVPNVVRLIPGVASGGPTPPSNGDAYVRGFPYGQTVVRLRAPLVTDRYGNEVRDWSDPDALDRKWFHGVGVAPRFQNEDHELGRTGTVIGLALYVLDVRADFHPHDRVDIDGQVYEVVGEPARWSNPFTGWSPGCVVNLERVDG